MAVRGFDQNEIDLFFSSNNIESKLKKEIILKIFDKSIYFVQALDKKLISSDVNTLRIYILENKQSARFELNKNVYWLLNNLYLSAESLSGIKVFKFESKSK